MDIYTPGKFCDLFLQIPLIWRPCQKTADDGKAKMGPIGQLLLGFLTHFTAPFQSIDLSPKEKTPSGQRNRYITYARAKKLPIFCGNKKFPRYPCSTNELKLW
jgi:hypothetical protein